MFLYGFFRIYECSIKVKFKWLNRWKWYVIVLHFFLLVTDVPSDNVYAYALSKTLTKVSSPVTVGLYSECHNRINMVLKNIEGKQTATFYHQILYLSNVCLNNV